MNFKSESGQTIIEAVVALAVVFIIVSAVTVAIITSISNSQFIKNQNLGNKYAQQGMEYVRRIQVEDISRFEGMLGTYSYDGDGGFTLPESTVVNVGSGHIRNITLSNDEDPCNDSVDVDDQNIGLKKVTVSVQWSSSKCSSDENRFCHNSKIVSCIPYEKSINSEP